MTMPENNSRLAPAFLESGGFVMKCKLDAAKALLFNSAFATCLGGATTVLCPVAASAATVLTAEASVSPLNEDSEQDEETSSDATADGFVAASASGTGTFFSGAPVETHDAAASIDYHSGALKARAEATSLSDAVGGGGTSVGSARLFDEITFNVSPTATSRDITFLWQIDKTISGAGYIFGFFQVRDLNSSFGNTLINDQFGENGGLTETGTYRKQATINLPDVPTSEAPVLRLEYLLGAQAPIYSVLVDGGSSSDTRGSLADSSNTGYLNIITPKGISFAGGGEGFLSEAPDLRAPAPIPLPAGGFLLFAAIAFCGLIKNWRL